MNEIEGEVDIFSDEDSTSLTVHHVQKLTGARVNGNFALNFNGTGALVLYNKYHKHEDS